MILAFVAATHLFGAQGFTWPKNLDWLKPRHPEKVEKPRVEKPERPTDKIRSKSYGRQGWSVKIRTDGFTGVVTCYIYTNPTFMQNRITYADGAMGFQFDDYVNTSKTWFRVDHQAAQKWTSVYATLNERHIAVPPVNQYNTEKTVVLIPIEEIGDGKEVFIRTADDKKPKRFRLAGFKEARKTAEANGCAEENFRRPAL